jgi:hypothetical protein
MQQTETIAPETPPNPEESLPNDVAVESAAGLEVIEKVNRRIPMPTIPEVSLAELEGKSVFDQFMMVWGTPERGLALWEMWLGGRDAFSREMLEQLAQSTAEEAQVSLDEAKRRLAVEKVLADLGPNYAIRFMESYRHFVFTYSRPLKPMVIRSKRKR